MHMLNYLTINSEASNINTFKYSNMIKYLIFIFEENNWYEMFKIMVNCYIFYQTYLSLDTLTILLMHDL